MWLEDSEDLYGTWVNPEYDTISGLAVKRVFTPDGTWAKYERIDTDARISGTFTITDRWTDGNQNIWYKVAVVHPRTGKYYLLAKLSNSGTALECACSIFDYPTAVEANSRAGNQEPIVEYSIYYRGRMF